jgi:tetratricopeptide (TPR) repeat protein
MRIGLLVVLLGLIAPPAWAATMQDYADCLKITSDDAQIATCSRVIEDKAKPNYERAMATYNRGVAYEVKGAYDEALADFNEVLRGQLVAVVYANRGLVYQRLRNYPRSIDDLNEALRLDPSLAQAYKWRGVSNFNIGENGRALADFTAAIRLDPKDSEPFWRRAQVYEVTQNLKAALDDYT